MCASSRARSAPLLGPGTTVFRWTFWSRGLRSLMLDSLFMTPARVEDELALHREVPQQADGDGHDGARDDVLNVRAAIDEVLAERVQRRARPPRRSRSEAPGPRGVRRGRGKIQVRPSVKLVIPPRVAPTPVATAGRMPRRSTQKIIAPKSTRVAAMAPS